MRTIKIIVRWVYAIAFIATGISHFVDPGFYLRIMPDYIPVEWHAPAVYISGVAEIVLAILLLIPATSRSTGWALMLFLTVVFPANLYAYQHSRELFPDLDPALHFWRLPAQNLMIALAFWFTRPDRPRAEKTAESLDTPPA